MINSGFILPDISYIDVAKSGLFWRVVRWVGQRFINFGAWVRAFGYAQKEIHPRQTFIEWIRNNQ